MGRFLIWFWDWWPEIAIKTVRAIGELISHALVAGTLIACMFTLESMGVAKNIILFNLVPVKFLFHGIDLIIIIEFAVASSVETWKILRGHE